MSHLLRPPRPRRRRLWLAATALLMSAAAALGPTAVAQAASPPVNVFPIPGGHVAAPSTQITLRGVPASQIGAISVVGSQSGGHTGRLVSDSDGQGASFLPSKPFKAGETVTVQTNLNIVGGTAGTYHFTVATPAGPIPLAGVRPAPRVRNDITRFVSRPDLAPTTFTVTKRASTSAAAGGDLFVAPQYGPVQNGVQIIGPYGGLIWYQNVPHNDTATDFNVQNYQGKKVLTWWQGNISFAGTGDGVDEIYNSSYQHLATVKAGNGVNSDLHEFTITGQNTALVTAYYPVMWNVSNANGAKPRIVLDGVVQEIDIPTGLVLFQWDSLDHVPVSASYQPIPKNTGHPWDYFHLNSAQLIGNGNVIISSRDTWAVYNVSHQTGAIVWTLGGKSSSFKMGPNASFAFQHDARLVSPTLMTVFDDGGGPPDVHKQSRGLTLRLDTTHMTASVVVQDNHSPSVLARYEGSDQLLHNGDSLVGFGSEPWVTEFNSAGKTVFDGRFVDANQSYRAYRYPWTGTPSTLPALGTRTSNGKTTVYASWNGSTQLARWQVLGGSSASKLSVVASAGKSAFETPIALRHQSTYVAVRALDSHGHVLATSHAVKSS
ncbi:MAG TPA: arylsulfotransferase family protein [Solirubrobacteraceae bacterium]|nr:arylsulfotransferase family protein [Solirubrobacteraceae bacterium]